MVICLVFSAIMMPILTKAVIRSHTSQEAIRSSNKSTEDSTTKLSLQISFCLQIIIQIFVVFVPLFSLSTWVWSSGQHYTGRRNLCLGIYKHAHQLIGLQWSWNVFSTNMKYREVKNVLTYSHTKIKNITCKCIWNHMSVLIYSKSGYSFQSVGFILCFLGGKLVIKEV